MNQKIAIAKQDGQVIDWRESAHDKVKRSSRDLFRLLPPFALFVTWYQRARFRAELLADLRHKTEYLKDIGICQHEATSEVARFFWEPVLLRRSLSNPPLP
ncbi:hypothetical protein ACE102_22490 [Bradyrhizobium sp. vgs-9]|uniref:hypothetical protein n=1 Tax=Bradyrhizobium TaxID=374 RepID=UPI001BA9C5C0|nr:hypothetical protein [Bradyrhizobium japonicum]MBR0766504.1 hypothetical protein [Bradyrhizobium japonicum]MBR0915833.1 hypothetical protein [Bradyrhizobium japonicum]